MLIRHAGAPRESEVTDQRLYLGRRALLAGGGSAAIGLGRARADTKLPDTKLAVTPGTALPNDRTTPREKISSYNNYYEFGYGKDDPEAYAGKLTTRPWTITVDGACQKPATFAIEDLLKANLQERIYRHRCVEAWSMVIPWDGFPLADLLARVEPTGSAKYAAFKTLLRPSEMPGQRSASLSWPYVEGLRLDEAMHPLTLLAVGLYGDILPNQNGAPIRLVVPWKYGFKGIKAIVGITLQESQPVTTWNTEAPHEYGFYANVNPEVDHPRWSQAKERRIGEFSRRDTLMFNGYGEQVASLYRGMDLRANF